MGWGMQRGKLKLMVGTKNIETVLFRKPAKMIGSTVLFINSGV